MSIRRRAVFGCRAEDILMDNNLMGENMKGRLKRG
jgi:hypothetical protein